MKRTIKIKLSFSPEIKLLDRKQKLLKWATGMLKGKKVNILEEKHLEKMSYIIVENTSIVSK